MTLLEALTHLFNHSDEDLVIQFVITFEDVTRTAIICKRWSKTEDDWIYTVKESYCPRYKYTEKQIVSAIAGIQGIELTGNMTNFKVSEIMYLDNLS